MATRKPTTKSKTKTSKSATTRISKSAKSKSVTKKSSAIKTARKSGLNLGLMHKLSAVLYLLLAAATCWLMQSSAYGITSMHLINDVFISPDKTVFVSATRHLFDLDLRWVLAGLLAASSVLPILYLSKLKSYYSRKITKGDVLTSRWIDFGISGSIMITIIALLSGYSDLMTLKLMGWLIVVAAATSWLAERQNAESRSPIWSAYIFSLIAAMLPFIAIASSMLHTVLYGAVRSPWYVYAAAGATLLGFILIALNQKLHYKGKGSHERVERSYLTISLLTKLSFAIILIVGLS